MTRYRDKETGEVVEVTKDIGLYPIYFRDKDRVSYVMARDSFRDRFEPVEDGHE